MTAPALFAEVPVSSVQTARCHNDEDFFQLRTPSSGVSRDPNTACPAIPHRSRPDERPSPHQRDRLVAGGPCLPLDFSATCKNDIYVRIPPKKLPSQYLVTAMKTFDYGGSEAKELPGKCSSGHVSDPINLNDLSSVKKNVPSTNLGPTSVWPFLPMDLSRTQGIEDNEETVIPPSKRLRMRPSIQRNRALFLDCLD